MKVKDIKNLPDETEIEINSVWDDDKNDLTPVACDGHYDKEAEKFYITPNEISVKKKSEEELRHYAQGVLDLIEDMLDEKDITIPDDERTGEESEARLYGTTYYELEDQIVNIMEDI